MSSANDRLPAAGDNFGDARMMAINIDLSTALAVSRASARTIAQLSPEAAKQLAASLDQEAASLDAKGGLESLTAALIVRRTLEPA